MKEPMQFIDDILQAASLKLIEVDGYIAELVPFENNPQFDIFIQVQKDLNKFIEEMEWTQSLIADGSI